MKKIISVCLLALVLMLNGCQLANENTNDINSNLLDLSETDIYSIPTRLDMKVISNGTELTNSRELFYYTWLDEDNVVSLDRTAITFGEGFSEPHFALHVAHNTINDVLSKIHTYNIEATVYYSQINIDYIFYPTLYMYYPLEDKTIERPLTSLALGSGSEVQTTNNIVTYYDEITKIEFNVTINYEIIQELQSVELIQYDESDTLITFDLITSASDIEYITVNEFTSYILAKETYLDKEGITSIKRTLISKEIYSSYFDLKFLFDDGFVHQKSVKIVWN